MKKERILSLMLDNWNKAVVFVDTDHKIRYMNLPAKIKWAKWGNAIGKSIFDCHNEDSCKIIKKIFKQLKKGKEEVMFTNSKKHRVYMRGVRNKNGKLIGYFERFEPPIGK